MLNEAAAKYSGYLDPDTIIAIEHVRADELVYFRLRRLGELELENSHITPLPLSYGLGVHECYRALDTMLARLRTLIERTGGERHAA